MDKQMTLDEAIERCEETAAEKEAKAKFYKEFARGSDMILITKWQERAKEHRQLAEWLKELKQYQERNIVCCKECVYSTMATTGECAYCDIWFPDEKKYVSGDYFCADGKRKNDDDRGRTGEG